MQLEMQRPSWVHIMQIKFMAFIKNSNWIFQFVLIQQLLFMEEAETGLIIKKKCFYFSWKLSIREKCKARYFQICHSQILKKFAFDKLCKALWILYFYRSSRSRLGKNFKGTWAFHTELKLKVNITAFSHKMWNL